MGAKGTKVTSREKKRMWELYQMGLTFSAIGKKMRRSPDTISRYVHQYEASLNLAKLLTQKSKEGVYAPSFFIFSVRLSNGLN